MKRRGMLPAILVVLMSITTLAYADETPSPSPSDSPSVVATTISPSPTPTPTPNAMPTLAALVDRPVPSSAKPPLAFVKNDRPKPYIDRCHTQQNLTASEVSCFYGNAKSSHVIVLFGDSHALSWFPAIAVLAKAKNWGFYSLTMSSCWPADIPAWNSTKNILMTNCSIWRKNTLKQISSIHPEMTFVGGTRGFSTVDAKGNVLTGDVRTAVWEAGMTRTLKSLKASSKSVIYLGDTPSSSFDVPACLMAHKNSIASCSTPFAKAVSVSWLVEEKHVADTLGVTWVDPTPWICTTNPCSPLSGNYIIYIDGAHLAATFSATLERPLWAFLTHN